MPTVVLRSELQNEDAVVHAALQGALVLTSNSRAARYLNRKCGLRMQQAGIAAWASPKILPWDAWLQDTWLQLSWNETPSLPLLLNATQEHDLWADILRSSDSGSGFTVDALAGLAQDAWLLLHSHCGTLQMLKAHPAYRVDWRRFRQWAQEFDSSCRRESWITRGELEAAIAARVDAVNLAAAQDIILWAFDRHTAAQHNLIAALAQRVKITSVAPTAVSVEAPSAQWLTRTSPEAEFRTAARWAASHLAKNPSSHLAILTTKAAEDRGALYRALSEELPLSAFSFSLGHPLAHFSPVRTSLLLLQWPGRALDASDISDLLLSRELAPNPQDGRERAAFETDQFRRRAVPDPAMDLLTFTSWLRAQLGRRTSVSMETLLRQCEFARQAVPPASFQLTAEDWSDRFRKILMSFGLPSTQGADSLEFQLGNRWEGLLDEFASLSLRAEKMPAGRAFDILERMATDTVFQPEAAGSAVEVIGPLEAAGSLFDGIFFTGCTDERWPIGIAPNPLLPTDLQKTLTVTASVRGAALDEARAMTNRILRSAPDVVFSVHQRNGDVEARPSVLLRDARIVAAEDDFFPDRPASVAGTLVATRPAPDATFPWEPQRRTLPTGVLQSQAACPFQAFATYRLRAREEAIPGEGLDAMQRGQLLHKLLERVWHGPDGLSDSFGLKKHIENNTLEAFVQAKAELVVADTTGAATDDAWQQEFLRIERFRLASLVCRWLRDVETLRQPFKVVAVEEKRQFSFDGILNFNVRVDRIDELLHGEEPTGELVLLDYKSSDKTLAAWKTPRIDQPQLPLYALHVLDSPPVALAFATLRGGEDPCLTGLAERSGILPFKAKRGSKPDDGEVYKASREEWRNDLREMAQEFSAGYAPVHPKRGSKTCEFCGLEPLCRIHERTDQQDAEEDEAVHD